MATLTTFLVDPAVVVACFALIFGLARAFSPERLWRMRHRLWPLKLNLWQVMTAVGVAAIVILVFERGYEMAFAVILISLFVLAWFVRTWCDEVVFLMGLRDDEFPGRNDKLIWVVVLFALAPITIWLFRWYRLAQWPAREPAAQAELYSEAVATTANQPA